MSVCSCEGCGAQADTPGEPCYACRGGLCAEETQKDPVIGDVGFLVVCTFLLIAAAIALALLYA
jgi:hypothetical protein